MQLRELNIKRRIRLSECNCYMWTKDYKKQKEERVLTIISIGLNCPERAVVNPPIDCLL